MSPKSPVRPMSLIGLILVFEALMGLQGFCMADEGWSLTGYQQIFHEPSSVQYMFLFYNKLVIGGLWEWLFGGLGIYGFRLLNILFMLATWFFIYRLMRNYIHPFTIVIGAILVTMAHNYGVMVFDHSSVTVLLSVSAAYFLFQSLCKGSALHIYIAGILLAVNIFSRIPNISQLTLLTLLIPYYIYTKKMMKTLQLLGGALLGVITGIAFEFGLMYCLDHLHLFIENLSTGMSAATSSDSSHSLSTMLPSYFDSYLQILKDMLKIAILPTLALLVGNLLKQSGLRKGLILFFALAQVAILVYFFDNMLFLYAFISIILIPSLYFLRKQPEQIYLILIALLILYLLPYGSDYGINNMGENAIWLATPLAIGLAHKGITYKTYKSYTTYQNHSPYKPYMVSIITMAPSTSMPKSTAPNESRFAGIPVSFISTKATSNAMGMVMATTSDPRKLPKNIINTTITSNMPISRVCETVLSVSPTRLVRSRNGCIFTPLGRISLFSSSIEVWTRSSTSDGFSPRSI